MSNFVELFSRQRRTLAAFEQPLAPIAPAFQFAMNLSRRGWSHKRGTRIAHREAALDIAKADRDEHLASFARAYDARGILRIAINEPPDREMAANMVADMLGAYGQKVDRRMLAGMLAAL